MYMYILCSKPNLCYMYMYIYMDTKLIWTPSSVPVVSRSSSTLYMYVTLYTGYTCRIVLDIQHVHHMHACTCRYICTCVTLRGWIKSAATHFISYKVCATVYTDLKLLQKIHFLTSCSNKCKTSDGIPW